MGFVGAAFEFRMELDADIKGMIREFNGFDQGAVRREAAEDQAAVRQQLAVSVVEFVAVTMALLCLQALVAAGQRSAGLDA